MMTDRRRQPNRLRFLALGIVLSFALGPLVSGAGAQDAPATTPTATAPGGSFNLKGLFGGTAGAEQPVDSSSAPINEALEGPIRTIESATLPEREMDEPDSPFKLMPDVVAKIVYGTRKFEYDTKGRPDPMIVPWVRVKVLSTEHLAQARAYMREGDELTTPGAKRERYLAAIAECEAVIKLDENSKEGKTAAQMKIQLAALVQELERPQVPGGPPPGTPKPKPPQWVLLNTKAVIYDQSGKGNHIVLVGDDVLKVGDKVPKHEQVTVFEVNETSVVYEFKFSPDEDSEKFTVDVNAELDLN